MNLSKKLQIPTGTSTFVVKAPKGFDLGSSVSKEAAGSAVLVFAINTRVLEAKAKPAIDAARENRLSWIVYPKAGQLGTDLNRDRLNELMKPLGIEGVRMVSIDDVWSAMRFRPSRRGE